MRQGLPGQQQQLVQLVLQCAGMMQLRKLPGLICDTYGLTEARRGHALSMSATPCWLRQLRMLHASFAGVPDRMLPASACVLCRTVTAGSKAHSRVSSRRTSEAAGQDVTAPQLQLPQLETGLSEGEVKDLAYLVFACNCPHEGVCTHSQLLWLQASSMIVCLLVPHLQQRQHGRQQHPGPRCRSDLQRHLPI